MRDLMRGRYVAGLIGALTIGVVGCSRFSIGREPELPRPAVEAEGDTIEVAVRDYPRSPTIDVVAWRVDEPWHGVRASVRPDGTLVEGHRVFIAAEALPNAARFEGATWHGYFRHMTISQPLEPMGARQDLFSCQRSHGCSPHRILTARLADSLLRGSRDSIVVRLQGWSDVPEEFVLRRPLIDAYLTRLDSVRAVAAARGWTASREDR